MTKLNQLAFSFASPATPIIPTNVIRHPVINSKPVTQSIARAALESSMGEARVLCERWGKSETAGTLEDWMATWQFTELRMNHSKDEDIRAEYALLRSVAAERYRTLKWLLKPIPARYANPADPSVTWSGRGRKPAWLEECVASGIDLESMEIGVNK